MTTFRMAVLNPESYSIPKNGFHCNSISRIADRLKIWDPGCPQGQKWFHPMSERVIGEGFLPKNATWWLHSCWIRTQDDIIIVTEPPESLTWLKVEDQGYTWVQKWFHPGGESVKRAKSITPNFTYDKKGMGTLRVVHTWFPNIWFPDIWFPTLDSADIWFLGHLIPGFWIPGHLIPFKYRSWTFDTPNPQIK